MDNHRLVIVWSSADPDVARNMVFMYSGASVRNGWFDDVTLIVWGPSSRLLTENKELQGLLEDLGASGVRLMARFKSCKALVNRPASRCA